ncbi:MAG: N(4)-(beta-N-acetylglucosaminyl)-L-asparaginase [Bacteroidetes bacterium]|nr:N(4)-(beta-N-acetylglucosaminyl)-L-asparaginase [Bacteroidota bacterium]MBS1941219.1 N(4)-(beta-N-acetylglucosaminyl)-L-asparaginase [Bacteroidota bacterium]
MVDRREFLRLSAITSAAALAGCTSPAGKAEQEEPALPVRALNKPVVVSTWDFGKAANTAAWGILAGSGSALDAVEAGARVPEADPANQSVGLGGRPDRDGHVTLDACIMDAKGRCGSVAALEHVVHAVSVARAIMEKTPHVMLVGDGALQFALANGFQKQDLLTEKSRKEWEEWLMTAHYAPVVNIENQTPGNAKDHDTIGILAMDAAGDLGGACTTSGMAYKLHGRVGDSPIIGAGLFVDNEVGGATSTGVGEEVIRIAGSHTVVELMRQGRAPEEACRLALERSVRRDPAYARTIQVGFLALRRDGAIGAYALQEGFTYAVKSGGREEIIAAKHIF